MIIREKDIPRNWLITGGCGFIGTSLIKQIMKEDNYQQIRILDNLSVGSSDDLKKVCDYTLFRDHSAINGKLV